ncbi:hypothetical protein CC78DRAFT_578120 [Lojkania enalia]|uniref:Uncharacterized protein n=1 Tax=Lojkania enalia TaxID=147567 RepID=A0A9P4KD47_9PLEO|nr:hypothetical protein CC78DRAFT_578120 [Didymosphaeria enalia]
MRVIQLSPLSLFFVSSFYSIVTCQTSTPQPSGIQQPITHPTRHEVLTPGGTFTIQWIADLHFSNVTLEIWDKTSWGWSREFGEQCYHWVNPFCGTIGSHLPNTGSYEWRIPKPGSNFPRGEHVFWIKMYVDDYIKEDIGNKDPVLSYSQNFSFAPEPGQNVSTSTTESASAVPTPPMELIPGTVTITVIENASSWTVVGPTGPPPTASLTPTGGDEDKSGEEQKLTTGAEGLGRAAIEDGVGGEDAEGDGLPGEEGGFHGGAYLCSFWEVFAVGG